MHGNFFIWSSDGFMCKKRKKRKSAQQSFPWHKSLYIQVNSGPCKCNVYIVYVSLLDMKYPTHCHLLIHLPVSLWVSGVTSRDQFRTSRHANCARTCCNSNSPFIVIALDDQYNNYRKFVKQDSVAREVVPLTHSGLLYSDNMTVMTVPNFPNWTDKSKCFNSSLFLNSLLLHTELLDLTIRQSGLTILYFLAGSNLIFHILPQRCFLQFFLWHPLFQSFIILAYCSIRCYII